MLYRVVKTNLYPLKMDFDQLNSSFPLYCLHFPTPWLLTISRAKFNTFGWIVPGIWYFKDLWCKMGLFTKCRKSPFETKKSVQSLKWHSKQNVSLIKYQIKALIILIIRALNYQYKYQLQNAKWFIHLEPRGSKCLFQSGTLLFQIERCCILWTNPFFTRDP